MFITIPPAMSIYIYIYIYVYVCEKEMERTVDNDKKRNNHHQFGKLLARQKRQAVVR
jgi:hypothetical protein